MKKRRRIVAGLLTLFLAVTVINPQPAKAAIQYMDGVTKEMSYASYWSDKVPDSDQVLADWDKIQEINQAIVDGKGTGMINIATWNWQPYDGLARISRLESSYYQSEIPYIFNTYKAQFDADGNRYTSIEDAIEDKFKPMVENIKDPDATTNMTVTYAICTTRTTMNEFPSDVPLYDDPTDPDFDYQPLSAVRVNEPLVIRLKSKDSEWYYATSSCLSGWVPAEDVALCADKEEWLDAWYSDDPNRFLVVCDDRIVTEESNYAPEISKRELTMGSCLKLAREDEWSGLINNRSAHNNIVVWMPVRNEDGSFSKKLALISEHLKTAGRVSEGYLPLTIENITRVALNQLGDIYGWSGMLCSNDCSGYVRDVYRCFGLDLARNTTNQQNQPLKSFNLSGMNDVDKAELIKTLPPGSVLFFSGHEMLYLGYEGNQLYVMSSVSNMMLDGARARIRSGVINTLEAKRANGNTWLRSLTKANVPYLMPDDELPNITPEEKDDPEPVEPDDPSEVTMFSDVTDSSTFFYDPVYWAADNGITTGWSDNTFRPWNACNRAAVVTFLWRMADRPEPDSIASFTDMPEDTARNKDFRKAISWAYEQGITTGFDDGTFRPWQNCNRAAIITFIWRYAEKPATESTATFTDMTGNVEFDKAISWGASKGIITGWEDHTFRPWNDCNRAATVTFLYRYDKQ